MSTRVLSDVVRGQIAFWLFTTICVALHPGFVLGSNEGGLSDYGTHLKTFVPYTLALAVTALYSLRAARHLDPRRESRALAWALRRYAMLLLLVLASTYSYSLDRDWRVVHFTLAITLALAEVIGAGWIIGTTDRDLLDLAFLALQWFGVCLLVLTGFFGVHVLFLTQVAMAGGFGGLIVRTSRRLNTSDRP
ncbi:MAG: hypothetical protein ACP5PB_02890 [Acidimicrobiales bacterium]